MSAHGVIDTAALLAKDKLNLDEGASSGLKIARTLVLAGVFLSAAVSFWQPGRFPAAYLIGFAFVLSISLGALCFVIINHLTRAGWSVVVRRPAEVLAWNVRWLWLLLIPIVIFMYQGDLQPKAAAPEHQKAHHAAGAEAGHPAKTGADDHGAKGAALEPTIEHAKHPALSKEKKQWLSFPWVLCRWVLYFLVWILMAGYFYTNSVKQDETKDPQLTARMQMWAAPALFVFALTTTFAGFDLLMALDPYWYSTIFGVYFWVGGFVGSFAALILILFLLQRAGYIETTVNQEHYQDVGKFLFAFTVFWAYTAFSQFMLIWYANLPEETVWYHIRTTGDWYWVAIVGLLFGHFIIPFLLLMSRWPKRRPALLAVGAVYMLGMHFFDLFWLVAPQKYPLGQVPVPLLDLTLGLAFVGLFMGMTIWTLKKASLIPIGDPRLNESLAFENY